jgi:hypothetical protein
VPQTATTMRWKNWHVWSLDKVLCRKIHKAGLPSLTYNYNFMQRLPVRWHVNGHISSPWLFTCQSRDNLATALLARVWPHKGITGVDIRVNSRSQSRRSDKDVHASRQAGRWL